MNQAYVDSFIKQALSSGVPEEKIAALLHKAEEISLRKSPKTAEENLNLIVSNLLKEAGLQKTASSVAYTNGILKQALDSGATPDNAITIAKEALDATQARLNYLSKISAIANDAELSNYAEGFLKAAMDAGMTEADATSALISQIDNIKLASSELFKQPVSGPDAGPEAGLGDDGAPAPGQGGPQEDPLQLIQSLPPEQQQALIQQLLAMIGGGQGGPQGAPQGNPSAPAAPGAGAQ